MAEPSSSNVAAFPSSPYAAELRRGAGSRSFSPLLELEYLRVRLVENRILIRAAVLLALFLTVTRGTEQILTGSLSQRQLGQFAVVLAASILLAVLACGPWFERLYLRFAQVLVPLRNSIAAMTIAGAASAGQVEALMLLSLLAIGPFFVLGLRFRAALLTVVITFIAYVASCAVFELAPPLFVRSSLFMLLVAGACGIVAQTLERISRTSFLESRLIRELAERDALTGLKNRRVFDAHLETLWEEAIAQRHDLALFLIDVDHFKAYNDRYGHQAGDRALRRVAETLQAFATRPSDLVARYGGEEFAVIVRDVDGFEAETLADRMRLAVATLALEHGGSRTTAVTISVGVAMVQPSRARSARGGLQLADQALYDAKQRGRNRVEVLNQSDHEALQTGVFSKAAVNGA